MWLKFVILYAIFIYGSSEDASHIETTTISKLAEGEQKMSDYILQLLDHFKKPNPVGLPGAKIPEPYYVPDIKHSIPVGTMYFKNTTLYGLSKFRILHVEAEIGAMEARGAIAIDSLQALGNYTMSTWLSKVQGPFTVDVTGIKVTAKANLAVERDGKLRTQDINIDNIGFSTIAMNIQNAGFLVGMLQGLVNSLGPILFDSIKPYILKEAYTKIREVINEKLDEVAGDMQFPNSISPLDMVVADVRKKIRDMEMDPYKVRDYNTTVSIFTVSLTQTWLTGISSIHRVGNISLIMDNNTLIADFEIGTQRLQGYTFWDISAINGLLSRAGSASFSVEYISCRIILAQPLDTRKKPEFRNLDLEVGNIQVRFDGAGTIDYVVEFAVNILPNLLRYQIMDALETPIKEKAQQEFDKLNVEEMIMEELPKVDQMQEGGFKLSALIISENKEQAFDEDEFFNF